MLPPRGDGIVLVEPEARGDELPQPLDVGLAENLLRPAGVRRADSAPVDAVVGVLLPADLRDLDLHRPADAVAVEIGEELGLGIPARPEQRVPGHVRARAVFCHSGAYVSAESGPNSIIACLTCASS